MSRRSGPQDSGFSLIEVIIATGILATGLLSLAGVFVLGLNHLKASTPGLIAREKAREAVESVHTARDMRIITWDEIRNVAAGGVFLDAETDLTVPGDDGLINTADDGVIEKQISAGADNILGDSDDVQTPLRDFKRRVIITDLMDDDGHLNLNLRQIQIIVRFKVGQGWRSYSLLTYISSYS